MSNIVVFFHIATINRYQLIVDEILEKIINSGLYSEAKKIYVTILGDGHVCLPKLEKIEICYQSNNIAETETPTINLIKEYSDNNINDYILYTHVKGVTSDLKNDCINDWRKYMSYFNIEKWKYCVDILKENDTCGVDLRVEPSLHYSGNFWWSTCKHISGLVRVNDRPIILSERHKCEFWICQDKSKKHYSMWDCGINVYERHKFRYEEYLYKK